MCVFKTIFTLHNTSLNGFQIDIDIYIYIFRDIHIKQKKTTKANINKIV